MLIDMCDMLTTSVVPVSTVLVAWKKRRTFQSFSKYTGRLIAHLSTNFSITIFLSARGGYIFGSVSEFNGNDLVREAAGGVVAVFIQSDFYLGKRVIKSWFV
jgi:hypothetical protein